MSEKALQPGFEPSKATVAQLRGILLEFAPDALNMGAKKKQLVEAYEAHVRPLAAELLAAREAVKPDGRGIQHISQSESSVNSEQEEEAPVKGKGKAKATRTPARKAKRAPKRELSDDEEESASPKKRRAKATDAAPSSSRRTSKARQSSVPPVVEPEPEDAMDVDEDPYVSPPKPRKSEPVPSSATPAAHRNRRKSHGDALRLGSSDGVESGFSDHNPFQRDTPEQVRL